MRGSILGSRALRAACACALALGIAPAAAWGVADNEQPASDVDALQEAVEDISNGREALPKSDEPAPGNGSNHEPADKQIPGENSANLENTGKNATEDESLVSDSSGSSFEPQAQSLNSRIENDSQTEGQTTTQGDVTLKLETTTINANVYKCQFSDEEGYHWTEDSEVAYELSVPEGADPNDYSIVCDDENLLWATGENIDGSHSVVIYSPTSTTCGTTLKVISFSDTEEGYQRIVHDTVDIVVNTTVADESCIFIPVENCTIPLGAFISEDEQPVYSLYDSTGELNGECIFNVDGGGIDCFTRHGYEEVIAEVTSSDSAVVGIDENDLYGIVNINGLGTATITVTLKNGASYSNSVTVVPTSTPEEPETPDDSEDIDCSQVVSDDLKFTQQTLNLTAGQSFLNGLFFENFISGKDSVNWSFYLTTSDQSILNYPFPEDEAITGDGGGNIRLTACKPGTAMLYLYFYNPETEESILTDTMTVNVKAASPTASSAPGSAYAGDIVSSGAADDIVKQEGLSLATSVKPPDSLTTDQCQGLLEVTNAAEGEKAVLVDISLVRSDNTAFDGYDELDNSYVFTVRLKLEGDLANLDPGTLRVYRIHEDGEMEPVTCWVYDGYLYVATNHFSPYAIVGQAKSATDGNTGSTSNGSQGGNPGTGNNQGGSTTTVTDKGGASNTSTAKNDAAKTSGASHSDTPLAQTGDELMPLAVALGFAAVLAVGGLIFARRRMSR